jgi:alginate O-acetyltransferase complex protein AlgJ
MLNVTSLRYRYTQFFVLFILCISIYVMVQSVGPGTTTFQDNLYKKDILMEKVTLLRMKLGDRIFPQVLLGKDGWMEYTGSGNIDEFQNLRILENKKIGLVRNLRDFNKFLKSQGITLLIVVAPDKATIYPDKLPEQIKSLSAKSRLDRFISYSQNNNLPIADLRPALRAARQEQDVYYKTNTHWNGYGAFAVYITIIDALGRSHPELKPYTTADLELVTSVPGLHDIPKLIHADFILEPGVFFAPKEPFVQTLHPGDSLGYDQASWIPDSKLPTLLMFHDSFGAVYLDDYLSMNFAHSNFIHLSSAAQYLTKESILQFKPDIIVIEIVERNLELLPGCLSNFAPK